MAIQFHCVACSQPIEVDEAWAGRLVECPYCHEAVTAPAFSCSGGGAVAPREPEGGGAAMPVVAVAKVVRPGNRLGVLALVLAIAGLLLWFGVMVGALVTVLNALGASPKPEEVQAFFEQAAKEGPPWFLKLGLAFMGAACLWVVGAICGIVAVRRRPRGAAVAALIVSGVPLMLIALRLVLPV